MNDLAINQHGKSHINGSANQTENVKSAPVLVKFSSLDTARKVFAAKSKLAKSGVFVLENLTKKRRDLLNAARSTFGPRSMTKEIETIISEESSIMTMPAPGPILNAPEHTLTAPEHDLTAPKPTLTAPELTLTDPKPTLTVAEPTLTAPGQTLTAPGTHLASLIAPEDDSRNPSMTLAISKDVKGKKPRNFFTICPFCRRSFYKLDKHFLAKKGSCSKNTNGEFWSVKEAKEMHELAKDELAERSQNKTYFLASQVSSLVEETKTLHGPSTSALPQQSPPIVETDFFSREQLSLSSQIRRRRVSEESDPEDVVDSDEGGSLYAPEIPEDESSEEEEEKSELRSEYFKKEWNWTSDIRKKMQKHGLYDVYTKNVKTEEEAKKMAKGIELMKKFEKWSAECGERSSRKFRNPFGCAQKIVYFILEGTKYNWLNFHSAERVELFFSKLAECGMKGSSRNKYAQGYSRFVKYITSRGSDAPPELNIALVNSVMSAVSFLDRKQKSLATAEMRHRELQRTFNPNSFTIDDYRNLKAGVEKFMAPVITRLTRNRLVEEDHTNITAYICFLVSFMYGHRPGVPENMTVTEFLNRHYVEEQKMFVILVEKHKTASIKSAGVALSEPEEVIFRKYLSFVRPALVKPDLPEPARAEEILKKMSEKRGIGADLTEALTEASLQMAIRRLGYQDTVPSLEEVQQTYRRFRIPKLFPSEPLVDDYLTQCVLNQSWLGMTVAQSLNKGAGQGVYATIPFYKNQVVVEIHGKRMATIEANRLFRSLLGEDDGSNYFLTVDQDVTIDAREEACACHPHQQCFGRLVNHKANEDGPNLKSKALVVDGLKRPFLVATRDITAGEELCFDYGVRPGQFNEGYEQMFLLPEKSRKRKRSARDQQG
ncbi:hypothetical protein QYM36_015655 [Artemia franciscana]|uniref:SET domain-containing protein n=1 Tax=Artemia franciscana TaxID=6661 RepID=A0AA88HNC8_ARTSF|nr:hypothetical protein QYM36_015655 [Artemia franciscana]